MQVSYVCDYSKGPGNEELVYRYQHPGNLFEKIYVKINVICEPLSQETIDEQIAIEKMQKIEQERLLKAKLIGDLPWMANRGWLARTANPTDA